MFNTNNFYKFDDFRVGDCLVYIDNTKKRPKKKYGIMTNKSYDFFMIFWEGSTTPTTFTRKEFNRGIACFCKKKDFKFLGADCNVVT